jgi:PqqD family protein of HPr-rel-A system
MTALTKLTDRFSETTVDDEIVVMNLGNGDFFSLKDSAKDIWEHIDGARSREVLIADLAQDYGIDAERIAAEVDAFLARLCEAGLLAHP